MNPLIDIIGVGADGRAGLRPAVVERIEAAEFLAGGRRHLSYFPDVRAERFVIDEDLAALRQAISNHMGRHPCVVLASGDPMFYSIGCSLVGIAGREHIRIEPALSSMQLAFARARIPWQGAALASIHGRDMRRILLPLLGEPLIGLFTRDGDSPAEVARFFSCHGLKAYQAIVGENLGAEDECVTEWESMEALVDQRFAPLNYLILVRGAYPRADIDVRPDIHEVGPSGIRREWAPGVPDEFFARPAHRPEVMTRQDVRSVVIGKLCVLTRAGDTFWDIGAGLGTVAVEMAVLRRDVEVVAVEQDEDRVGYLRQNREWFETYNVRVIEGPAPDALTDETERPRLVFLGGSGGRLPAILDLVHERLRPGGRLVANFVTLEHLTEMLARVKTWAWPFEVTEISVSRSAGLAGLTGLKPQRSVFLVQADKPEKGHA
jgi:precorrin-6Y C5,15-methyltransferase (decarboxylating)